MTAIVGYGSLLLACVFSIALVFGIGQKNIKDYFYRIPLALFLLMSVSFGSLIYAYAESDFSILNVYLNSHSAKPLLYKLTGTWGNHEGSMLMFVWLLAIFTALLGSRAKPSDFKHLALRVQAFIILLFLFYMVLASNPFITIAEKVQQGLGLNPLLQDVGLAIHPPLLYTGYCGLSIAFAFAVTALIQGKLTKAWSTSLHPWLMTAWGFLTLGIGFGSWWAYRELGWGGFWFWDPVENSSLLPWLAATALLHSSLSTNKRAIFKGWTIFLAILAFSFSLTGFFLVRSGILTSVHSFASDPTRGLFILLIIFILVGGAFTLYALRLHKISKPTGLNLFSKETAILINNILLLVMCVTVFLGVIYPILLSVFTDKSISVGGPYYNAIVAPLTYVILVIAAIAPFLKWKNDDLKNLKKIFLKPLLVTVVGVLIAYLISKKIELSLIIGLCAWLISMSLVFIVEKPTKARKNTLKQYLSMEFGHIGLAVLVFSIAGNAYLSEEKELIINMNEEKEFHDYVLKYEGDRLVTGKNYYARQGSFKVSKDGKFIGNIHPEARIYPVEGSNTTEASIIRRGLSDLYIVIGDVGGESSTSARFYYNAMVNGIWLGFLLISIAGILYMFNIPSKKRL